MDQYTGEICAVLTAATWAVAMIFFKLSGDRIPPLALNFFKNTVGLVLLVLTLLVLGHGPDMLEQHSSRDIWILLISGFIGIALADTVFFYALNLIGVGIIAIVDCLYSPCIIMFAFFMLSEKLTAWQLVGAVMVISAVLFSSRLKPPRNRTHAQLVLGIILGAIAMGMMGFGIVLAKPILNDFPLVWATTLRLLAGTVSLAVFAIVVPKWRSVWSVFRPAAVWKWSMPGAFLGAYVSMILWVAGFKYSQAMIASVLNQTSTIFAIILATVILKEEFTRRKLIAVVLAMTGVVLVSANSEKPPMQQNDPHLSRQPAIRRATQTILGSRLGEPFPNGEPRQLDTIMDVQLVHQAARMAVDRVDADVNGLGDLFLGEPLSEIPEHFLLTLRQGGHARVTLLAKTRTGLINDDSGLYFG
jgi:drug/metabolite transporter (DMT)-like permease